MPTYKHPCPHCGTFINRDVVACPKCGTSDPFAPGRCPACGAVIEDASWVACPRCGKPVGAAAVAAAAASAQAERAPGQDEVPWSQPAGTPATSGAPGAIPGWGQSTPKQATQPAAPPQAAHAEPAPVGSSAPAQVGSSAPAPVGSSAPAPAAACAACGSPLAPGARFCLDCGAAVA